MDSVHPSAAKAEWTIARGKLSGSAGMSSLWFKKKGIFLSWSSLQHWWEQSRKLGIPPKTGPKVASFPPQHFISIKTNQNQLLNIFTIYWAFTLRLALLGSYCIWRHLIPVTIFEINNINILYMKNRGL